MGFGLCLGSHGVIKWHWENIEAPPCSCASQQDWNTSNPLDFRSSDKVLKFYAFYVVYSWLVFTCFYDVLRIFICQPRFCTLKETCKTTPNLWSYQLLNHKKTIENPCQTNYRVFQRQLTKMYRKVAKHIWSSLLRRVTEGWDPLSKLVQPACQPSWRPPLACQQPRSNWCNCGMVHVGFQSL